MTSSFENEDPVTASTPQGAERCISILDCPCHRPLFTREGHLATESRKVTLAEAYDR